MNGKWIGAVLIILGCGGFGFRIALGYRSTERLLRQLLEVLETMESELQYRLLPLPTLLRRAARDAGGTLREVFARLAEELDRQSQPDAAGCMRIALDSCRELPAAVRRPLRQLGQTLGRFDLPGQIHGLKAVQDTCRRELTRLENNRDVRLRSYQTLGLCAGAALAILFA